MCCEDDNSGWQSSWHIKSLLMNVKEDSEKVSTRGHSTLTKLTSGLAVQERRAVLAQQTGQRLNQEC